MTATMPARSVILRAREYAEETGQDTRDVYVRLLAVIGETSPEAVDAAFAELRAQGSVRG